MATCLESACSDCLKSVGSIPLSCDKHCICDECFLSRGKRKVDAQKCTICESAGSLSAQSLQQPEPGIWIYVDDSNIWIEAKKLASKTKKFKTDQDHRVRIDVGRLTEVVANGRPVEQGFLYGSEPPPVDTVWEKIKKRGWAVDTKKRSRISGKEKKVDTQLVVDVTEKAITTPVEQRSTIILITGDADVIPAIKKVQEYKGWSVEVYMWEHALSAELKALHSKKDSVSAFSLDSYLDKITFTNMKFNLREHRHLLPIVEASGVVFSMRPGIFQNRVPTKKWCRQIESITQWPFQYYWFEEHHTPTDDLVLVFREDYHGRLFDVKQFIDTLVEEEENSLPFVDNIQTFLRYSQRKSGLWKTVHGVGHYSWDDVLETSDRESANDVDDSDEASEWQLVRNEPRKPKQQRYSEPCPYGFNCKCGSKCWKKHTKDELDFFRKNKGKGNPVRKVKQCFFPGCKKKKEDCPYAHGEDDAWCLICCKRGHFTDNCQANE